MVILCNFLDGRDGLDASANFSANVQHKTNMTIMFTAQTEITADVTGYRFDTFSPNI